MLGEDGDFELEFTSKHHDDKSITKTKAGKHNDQIENLLL